MNKCFLALAFALLAFAGCNNSSTSETASSKPSPEPSKSAASDEAMFQRMGRFESDVRTEARQAAIQYIQNKLPKWTIKGVASHHYEDNNFWISVDIENGGRSVVLRLYVEKFFPESGEPYWKAVPTTSTLPQQLHEMKDLEILKELNEAENP